jgi:hypothetical protein
MYKKAFKILTLLFSSLAIISCSNNSKTGNEKDYESSNSSNCNFKDNRYSATVDYNNPETNFSNTYSLDVEVEDCQVVKIYFPKGGWLDEDHISPADIDDDGNATVEGEDGKAYKIHIDN